MNRVITSAALPPLVFLILGVPASTVPEPITPNDNRQAAGTLRNGVLTLSLEARTGVWRPEGEGSRALEVAAFGEKGKPLSAPGPLVRVPVGTVVRATIRNTLDKPLVVYGFGKTRGMSDSTMIPGNGERLVSFTASAPGTYFYTANRGLDPFGQPDAADMQLNGAIVVDPPNARIRDRVLLISWWVRVDPTSPTGLERGTMAINGLSWPHTERLDHIEGDSIHWRVINMTGLDHPMHLHGFYFRLNARGDGVTDSLYPSDQRRMAVTEIIDPLRTMSLSWKAERPGNWIFHCHYALHLSTLVALDMNKGVMESPAAGHGMTDHAQHQMFGLVMGIRIAPKGPRPVVTETPRAMRVVLREKAKFYGDEPGFSFILGGTPEEADLNAMSIPAAPLVLERDRPVAITVVNAASEPAAIHWHGIELESFPDGVPGWSGSGTTILPAIVPRDSLTVTFTPPRAGSFMYHSHINESMQMGGGAYGPIIVVEPGKRFDQTVDKVLFFGTAGLPRNVVFGPFTDFLMNGHRQPPPMDLRAGTRYRFRLFNLAGDFPLVVELKSGETPVDWTFVAKDGFTLPAAQVKVQPATLLFDPGEIYDFEYTPATPGDLTLTFGPKPAPPPPPGFSPMPPTVKVAVRVR